MQVLVGSSLSDYYDQAQCVPQGGVLSTTFFSIIRNDIVKCTDFSLYVDDFCIIIAQKAWGRLNFNCNKNLIKLKIGQQAMTLSFFLSNTQCVHFCQLHKQHDSQVLNLYG